MVTRQMWAVLLCLAAGPAVGYDEYTSAKSKISQIESDRLRAGTRIDLTPREVTAWVQPDLPGGVRNPRLQFTAPGVVVGSALVDFIKVQRSQGHEPNWLITRLLEGERQVSVTARIRSSGGTATVDVQRVVVGSLVIDGDTLDLLIQNVLLPMYPDAAIGRPFELGHRIEKLDVQPAAVGVVIGR